MDKGYEGPALGDNDEVTMDAMYSLATHYFQQLNPDAEKKKRTTFSRRKQKAPPKLHPKYVLTILAEYLKVLKGLPNVVRVSTAVSQTVTVVGDVHGQLRDLQLIFEQNSMPSTANPYIFNGDIVDRGSHSLEVCMILFGLAVADPTCVRINRGNHEDYSVCDTYGFTDEIFTKYPGKMGIEIAELFAEVFAFLPIATIVDDSVLVVHGGLGRYTLEFLNSIERHQFKTLQGVPEELWEGEDYGSIKHDEWEALMDALWSDPGDDDGLEPNYKRGAGATWGPDVTERWLDREGLTELIRSHECVEYGYLMHHNNRVMTLFSASCYYDGESNWGAYVRLNSTTKDLDSDREVMKSSITLEQYCVDESGRNGGTPRWKDGDAAAVTQASIERIRLLLYDYKERLRDEFCKLDPHDTGAIAKKDWAEVMGRVVALKLPWLHLREHFVPLRGRDKVEYKPFIEELRASFTAANSSMEVPVPEYIYRNLPELEACFRLLDGSGSGVVSRQDFGKACDALSLASKTSISESDKQFLVDQLDPEKTDKISFVDFLNSIRYSYMDLGPDAENAAAASPATAVSSAPVKTAEEVDAEAATDEDEADDEIDEPVDLHANRPASEVSLSRRGPFGLTLYITLDCGVRPRSNAGNGNTNARGSSRTPRRRTTKTSRNGSVRESCRSPSR